MLSIDKLLGAARNLFVSQGYKSTTLEKIAHAANLTKGSVYFYFRSKEAVLLTLLDRAEQNVIDTAVQAIDQCDGPSLDKIVAFLHHQARLEDVIREDMLLIIRMSLEFAEGRASKRLEELYRKLYSALEAVVREGQIAGDIRSDIPSRELASILVVNHDGTFMEWYRRSSYVDGKNLVRAMRSTVLDGLRVDQGRPTRSQSLEAKPERLGTGRSKPRAARLS
jgi:AcrR family transcriptional regulator